MSIPSEPDDKYDYTVSAEEKAAAQKFFSSTEFKELDRKLSEVKEPTEPERAGLRDAIIDICYRYGVATTRMPDAIEKLIESTCKEVIGSDEEVPEDIWHTPYPQTYRDRNQLREEQLARLAALIRGEGS